MSCEITGRVSPSLTMTGSVVSGTQIFGRVSPSLTMTGSVVSGTQIFGRVSPSLTMTGSVVSGTQIFGRVSPSLTMTGSVETVCMKGKPFIVVTPDVMWLTPDNGFTDDFDVWANVDWKVE